MNNKFTSLEESLAEFNDWATQLAESEWITSDKPLHAPGEPSTPEELEKYRAQDVRKQKQSILSDYAKLGANNVEFQWAGKHDVFMNKEQILDYLDQTVSDPDLSAIEYMHNMGYNTDGLLKGMLKSMASAGLSKLDIFSIFKSARRGKSDVSPGMISRVAKQALRSEMSEQNPNNQVGNSFMPNVGDEILWRPKNAKMPPAPVTVVAANADKLTIKLQSPGMIQRAGKDTLVVSISNSDISPKPVEEGATESDKNNTFWVYNTKNLAFVSELPSEQAAQKKADAYNKESGPDAYAYARGDKYWNLVKAQKTAQFYKDWINSEYAPQDSDAGDDREVIRKATTYLQQTQVPRGIPQSFVDEYAEALADQYHGGTPGTNSNWLSESKRMKMLAGILK